MRSGTAPRASRTRGGGEDHERDGVREPLVGGGEDRLQHEGVGEQGAQRAEVRGRVQEVGILGRGVVGAREPRGDERGDERGRDEDGADLDREGGEQPRHGAAPPRRFPEGERGAGRQGEGGGEPQERERRDLPRGGERACKQMREGVAREQRALEEDEGDGPRRGRPAERGQEALDHEGLDPEDQEGPGADREEEDRGGGDAARHGGGEERHRVLRTSGRPRPARWPERGRREGRGSSFVMGSCMGDIASMSRRVPSRPCAFNGRVAGRGAARRIRGRTPARRRSGTLGRSRAGGGRTRRRC